MLIGLLAYRISPCGVVPGPQQIRGRTISFIQSRSLRKKLPAGFPRLTRVAAVIVTSASATATTEALATATPTTLWPVGLGLSFVDSQRPPAEVRSVQGCDGFVGCAG